MKVYVVQWCNGMEKEDCLSVWLTREDADAEAKRLNIEDSSYYPNAAPTCLWGDYTVREMVAQ